MSANASHNETLTVTPRQRQVLDMLTRGMTNPQIAEALGISLPGAKWHVSEVMNKLGAASREEAAEVWQAHERLRSRAARLVRGIGGLALLKWAVIGGAAAAGVGATIVTVSLIRGEPEPERPAPAVAAAAATPPPLFTAQQVDERARHLAVEALAAYSPHVMTRAEEDEWKAEREKHVPIVGTPSFQMAGRPVNADDYVVLEARFVPGATSVESNVEGYFDTFDSPRDVWVVKLGQKDVDAPDVRPTEAAIQVTFEDGTGELVGGGRIGEIGLRGEFADGMNLDFVAQAEFDAGPVTFWVDGYRTEDHPGYTAGRPGSVCLAQADSRMAGNVARVCGPWTPDPISDAMHVTVHNSQGYAHASGLVTANVARIRLLTEDGRELFVEPGPLPASPQFPYRGFIAAAPGPEWFVLVEALDADGNVLDSSDTSNHPANPPRTPPPGP